MPRHIELNPVSHITIGTVGEPGNRTFYLQGSRRGRDLVTLTIEKQQAVMLASSLASLLKDVEEGGNGRPEPRTDAWMSDHRLREPLEPLFRVGNLGLGYSDEVDRVVIVAYELVAGQEEEMDEETQDVVSFWASREQIQALIPHIETTVKSGRPICGNCGSPIDASGHFCPRRNGHLH